MRKWKGDVPMDCLYCILCRSVFGVVTVMLFVPGQDAVLVCLYLPFVIGQQSPANPLLAKNGN